MINVPVLVRDALRSGDYKKNYRILVQDAQDEYTRVEDMVLERIGDSNSFSGTYPFNGFVYGDNVNIRYPLENAFRGCQIYKVSHQIVSLVSYTGNSETVCPFVFRDYDVGATFTIFDVSFIPQGTNTATFEVWRKANYIEINNNNLIDESVKFDERMCSDSNLKFGLCEGTEVTFQYFGMENINGKSINIYIDVEYVNSQGNLEWYPIEMGQYDVIEYSRQASTGIMKATARNKLRSTYFDKRVNEELIELLDNTPSNMMPVCELLKDVMAGDAIEKQVETETLPINMLVSKFNLWGVPEAGTNGRIYNGCRVVVYELGVELFPEGGFDPNEIYQFVINTNNPVMSRLFSSYMQRSDEFYYHNYDIWQMWDDGFQASPTVMSYIEGNFEYSHHYTGYVEIKTNRNTYTYKLYKSNRTYDTGFITDIVSCTIYIPINIIYGYILPDEMYDLDIAHELDANLELNELITQNDIQTMVAIGSGTVPAMISDGIITLVHQISESAADSIAIYKSDIENITEDITLRDVQSAVFEINCQYGKLDRATNLFTGIELSNGHLRPHDGLYPATDLVPQGNSEAGYPSMYSKLWADEGNIRSFKYLIITYKAEEDGQEVEKTLQRTVNTNGTDNYNMSDNWLFKNFIWTAQQVGAFADAMVAKMQNIRWFPFEMWCAGLPFLEAGDAIEINMKDGVYPTYILRRTLSGIQNLQDEMINGTLDIF